MSTEESEATKKSLKARRGGHKAYATKVMTEVKSLISNENPRNRAKLTAFLKTLTDRKDVIASLDNEILGTVTDEEMEEEIMSSGDYALSLEESTFTF